MNLGFQEMLFIFVLALLLFGPKKLPQIARQIGKALAEFKRASNEIQWRNSGGDGHSGAISRSKEHCAGCNREHRCYAAAAPAARNAGSA